MEQAPTTTETTGIGPRVVGLIIAYLALAAFTVYSLQGSRLIAMADSTRVLMSLSYLSGVVSLMALWLQVFIGPFEADIAATFRAIRPIRLLAGAVAVIAAATSSALTVAAQGFIAYIRYDFVKTSLIPFEIMGEVATLIMITAFVMGSLPMTRTKPWLRLAATVLNSLALGGLLVYWRVATDFNDVWPGGWVWWGLTVSFCLLTAWRLFPGSDDDADEKPAATAAGTNPQA
jgi:hypothetical protein